MKTVRSLQQCAADAAFVRVRRRGRRVEVLSGVVIAVGRKWFGMAVDHDAGFSGFTVLRVGDVREVIEPLGSDFLQKSWALEGHWPAPHVAGLALDGTRKMVDTLGSAFPLLTIHYEYDEPDACVIGTPTCLRRRGVDLLTISPDASWDDETFLFPYREISRVDVGDAYARRLLDVGGPPRRS